MRNIAVMTGAAGAGKTTIAKYLVEHCGYHRIRFAGPLKAMAAAMGLSEDEIDGHLKDTPSSKLQLGTISRGFFRPELVHAIVPDAIPERVHDPLDVFGGWSLEEAMTMLMYVVLKCIVQAGTRGATPRSLMQMIGTDWGRKMIREDLWVDMWRQAVAATPYNADIVIDDCRFPNELDECNALGRTLVFRVERDAPSVLTGEAEKSHESEKYSLPFDFLVRNNSVPADAGEFVRHRIWRNHLDSAKFVRVGT
jgi:hypothetical protein